MNHKPIRIMLIGGERHGEIVFAPNAHYFRISLEESISLEMIHVTDDLFVAPTPGYEIIHLNGIATHGRIQTPEGVEGIIPQSIVVGVNPPPGDYEETFFACLAWRRKQ